MVSEDFKKIISHVQNVILEIEKLKKYRKISFFLTPLIIGFYLINKYNQRIDEKLQYFTSIQSKLTNDIKKLCK